ncbi:hypothetical protein SLE2022_015480 [Rubroshorea leprosula]
MAASAPVAIGTRGTVGSLVRKEIEYFAKLEIDTRGSSSGKAHGLLVDVTSCSGQSRRHAGLWFSMMSWRRKKQRAGAGFLPSMCSAVEVADSNQLNGIPGFHYRILKNDQNNFHF